ncbi:protein IMPACT-like [Spodoptera litura]|uniref:Protein IMPACT-like n=1 Tax=Spodoptera litura TaxID=69820 RepID=A0A9J7J485_SPOLT|nr:protein IMPACT-like [Spodoptera litura]
METNNLNKQNEEIEALSAIYGDDWTMESDKTRSYSITIYEKKYEVVLYVTMPEDYPSQSPPSYEFSAPWMDRKDKSELHQALDEIYLENIGKSVVYQWVEKIREVLQTIKPKKRQKVNKTTKSKSPPTVSSDTSLVHSDCPEITHGEVIVDRKSIFQGHAAEVHSIDDVK